MLTTDRRDHGFTTPGFLLTTVTLMFAILLAVQVALYYLAHRALAAAADEGARAARAYDGSAAAGRAAGLRTIDQIAPRLVTGPRVTATRTATNARVTATGRAVSLAPGFALHLTVTITSPVERVS